MRYIPDSCEDEILKEINFTKEKLFSDIPEDLRSDLDLWDEKSEMEVKRELKNILDKNRVILNFLGAGVYNHYIPSAVKEIVRRSEFYSCYTPYQPEVSQGMLQALFEYQSLMAELLDMDVRVKKKPKFIISKNIHPERREVLKTYTEGILEIVEIGYNEKGIDLEDLKKNIDNSCGVYIENPTFLGYFEQKKATSNICSNEALCAVASAVYLSFLGKKGLKELAELCMKNSNYTMKRINEIKGFKAPLFNSPHFKEFTVYHKNIREIDRKLLKKGGDIMLIFDYSKEGRKAYSLPHPIEDTKIKIPEKLKRKTLNLPEVSEIDIVRHFIKLSQKAR